MGHQFGSDKLGVLSSSRSLIASSTVADQRDDDTWTGEGVGTLKILGTHNTLLPTRSSRRLSNEQHSIVVLFDTGLPDIEQLILISLIWITCILDKLIYRLDLGGSGVLFQLASGWSCWFDVVPIEAALYIFIYPKVY